MSLLLTLMASALGMSQLEKAQTAPAVEVMVLGTYHFDNPGLDLHNPKADDVLQPKRQSELEALALALAEFRPTRIMVEKTSPDLLDDSFATFTPELLKQKRTERVQIAYRLAYTMGHQQISAIDEQPGAGEPDYFPFEKLMGWAQKNGAQDKLDAMSKMGRAKVEQIERLQAGTIPGALAELNKAENTLEDQKVYYTALMMGDAEQQPGADLNAMWYLRNAKIFAKLKLSSKPGDRVLVVYGAGHNYWLRHFAATAPGFRSVDPVPYLLKADRMLKERTR